MAKPPLISIIMPALNASAFIAEAIDSVLTQSWTEWELLVVDNGSTDDTTAIVRAYTDPRITLLHCGTRGVSLARNQALQQMRGEFYCFLDADDILPASSLADRATLLVNNASVFFADGAMRAFKTNDPCVWERTPTYRGPAPLQQLFSITGACFLGPTWMIRRTAGPVPLFRTDMTHAEDLLYYMSIAHHGAYDHVPHPVLHYRVGTASAMSDLDGLHRGYRQLMRAMHDLPIPPDEATLQQAWARIRSIMFKSYLKKGRFLAALSAWFGSRPDRPAQSTAKPNISL